MIDRRTLLRALPALMPVPLAPAMAQAKKPKLAMLLTGTERGPGSSPWPGPLRQLLAEAGWRDGQTIDIVQRFAGGELARVPALAEGLVAQKPNIIFTHTGSGARAVAAATKTIPIVVGAALEETLLELAGELARPKGNVTGLILASDELHAKCLDLLKQMNPSTRKVGVLVDPDVQTFKQYPARLNDFVESLHLELARFEVRNNADIDTAFSAMADRRVDSVLIPLDPKFNQAMIRRRINALGRSQRIAVVTLFNDNTRDGALMSFGADYRALVQRSAHFIDKILKGAMPGDLPIERPTVFKLIINKQTARILGFEIPPALLLRADEVIE